MEKWGVHLACAGIVVGLFACAVEENIDYTSEEALAKGGKLKVVLGVSSGCFERHYIDRCWPWAVYADPANVKAQLDAINKELTENADDDNIDFDYQVSEVTCETGETDDEGLLYCADQNVGIFGGVCRNGGVEISIMCKREYDLWAADEFNDPSKYHIVRGGDFVALVKKTCWNTLTFAQRLKIGAVLSGVPFVAKGVLDKATDALKAIDWYDGGECRDLKGTTDAEKAKCEFEDKANGTECKDGVCQSGECVAKADCSTYEEDYADCWHAVYDEEYNVCIYDMDDDGTACDYWDGGQGACESGNCVGEDAGYDGSEEPVDVGAEEPAYGGSEEPVDVGAEEPVEEPAYGGSEEPADDVSEEPAYGGSEEPGYGDGSSDAGDGGYDGYGGTVDGYDPIPSYDSSY